MNKINKINKIIFLIIIAFQTMLYAADPILSVKVNPAEVVLGDTFVLEFHIETDVDGEPEITYNAVNADTVGTTGKRTSSSSTYINGQWQSKQEIIIGYELEPKRLGKIFINEIKVVFNGKTLKHNMVFAEVRDAPRQSPILFVEADLSQKEAFVNESVIVKYYLYYKVPIKGRDVEKFPVFNGFIKRMHEIAEADETVNHNGEIYYRSLIYAVQVYPSKAGELKIPSIRMLLTYIKDRKDPFGMGGGFGSFGFRGLGRKSASSKVETLKVYDLPTTDVPKSFKGLVEKHNFELKINRTKFLVNEPIEIQLKVTGSGALEKLDAPSILNAEFLEEFEVSSDLETSKDLTGVKTFNYTFLGRSPGKIPEQYIEMSYFNPQLNKYETVSLKVPEIIVEGGASSYVDQKTAKNQGAIITNPKLNKTNDNPYKEEELKLLSPFEMDQSIPNISRLINIIIFIVSFILLIGIKFKKIRLLFSNLGSGDDLKLNYSNLVALLNPLIVSNPGKSFDKIIGESNLSEEAKIYFTEILAQEVKDFQSEENLVNPNKKGIRFFNKKYYKEVKEKYHDTIKGL